MPDDFHAELIGGIVYLASPLGRRHATNHLPLASVFFAYQGRTPGVEAADDATLLLGDDAEPQPDLYLRILPECGGQSRTTDDDYVAGPPELVAEIAHGSRAIDLHAKKDDYTRHGVLEYIVLSLEEPRFRWFDLHAGLELVPDDGRVCRLRNFPGLWIDIPALFATDFQGLMATLDLGLASPEHDAFVRRLAGR